MKYCRAKKATEKLKIYAQHKILKNEVKMKSKQAKEKTTGFIKKKIKQIYQKFISKSYSLYCQCESKK